MICCIMLKKAYKMMMWLGALILFSDMLHNVREGITADCVKLFPPHILLKIGVKQPRVHRPLLSHHAFT